MSDNAWKEEDSKDFIAYGDFFIPYRKTQTRIIYELLGGMIEVNNVMDLCCGNGVLSKAILEKFNDCTVEGFDGSEAMLQDASKTLKTHGDRFVPKKFDIKATDWRHQTPTYNAIISSLAIHHLEAEDKAVLYHDLFHMINPGGVIVVADIVLPTTKISVDIAKKQWAHVVMEKSMAENQFEAYDTFKNEGWNYFEEPESNPYDHPSPLFDQLKWLEKAGFQDIDVVWLYAGHAIFCGWKSN